MEDVQTVAAGLSRTEREMICRPEMTVDGRVVIETTTPAWVGNRKHAAHQLARKRLTKIYSATCDELTELGLAVRQHLGQ